MRRGTSHEDKKKMFASSKNIFWDARKTISCVQYYYKIAKTILKSSLIQLLTREWKEELNKIFLFGRT
jgi:hypothetical protein